MQTSVFHFADLPLVTQCTHCGEWKRQANVCHSCRASFIPLVPLGTGAEPFDCSCLNCDFYGVPCLNCAEYSFGGLLGEGHGNTDDEDTDDESEGCCGDCGDDSSDEGEPMDIVWEAAWGTDPHWEVNLEGLITRFEELDVMDGEKADATDGEKADEGKGKERVDE